MKKPYLFGLGVIIILGAAWISLMRIINNQTTIVHVQVSGSVDEVRIFQVDDQNQPVAVVTTRGKDTQATVELRNSIQSSFLTQSPPTLYNAVLIKGDASRTIPHFCCAVGLTQRQEYLTIDNLDQWQQNYP